MTGSGSSGLNVPRRLQTIYFMIILVLAAGIIIFTWALVSGKIQMLADENGGATLRVTTANKASFKVGESFPVYIQMDSGENGVAGVDVNALNYDQSILEVVDADKDESGVQITPEPAGDMGWTKNEATNGKVYYSAKIPNETSKGPKGNLRIAIISFKAISAGTASFSFDFNGQGSTDDSSVTSKNGCQDILLSTQGTAITITGASQSKSKLQNKVAGVSDVALDYDGPDSAAPTPLAGQSPASSAGSSNWDGPTSPTTADPNSPVSNLTPATGSGNNGSDQDGPASNDINGSSTQESGGIGSIFSSSWVIYIAAGVVIILLIIFVFVLPRRKKGPSQGESEPLQVPTMPANPALDRDDLDDLM